MKGYANPQLLVTPDSLAAELGVRAEPFDAAQGRPFGSAQGRQARPLLVPDSTLLVPSTSNQQSTISHAEPASGSRPPASGIALLDLRPAEQFAAGHIPGAAHVDLWGVSLIDTDPAPMRAFLWMVVHVLEARGVDGRVPVVVYDEQSGLRAARAFWFLEYFGHPSVRLLDGGYGAWTRDGLPVAAMAPGGLEGAGGAGTRSEERGTSSPTELGGVHPSASSGCPEPVEGQQGSPPRRDWNGGEPRAIPERVATWRDVRDRLGRADVVLLDTRSDGEYCGTLVRAKRGGAIPGAVHIEWTRNLGPDGAFKPAVELREMYEQAGVTPDKDVIAYCQGGYRAAHTYVALRLLGYPRIRNYIGSWKEWGDREELPIEMPRQP